MKRYVIERDMPGVRHHGTRAGAEKAAQKSNSVLWPTLAPDVQCWIKSYVTPDKIYCVYMAKDEAVVKKHAEFAGFPADRFRR